MQKLKWKYDKLHKQWWVNVNSSDGFCIAVPNPEYKAKYKLTRYHLHTIGRFEKLSSAKTVANLLIYG